MIKKNDDKNRCVKIFELCPKKNNNNNSPPPPPLSQIISLSGTSTRRSGKKTEDF